MEKICECPDNSLGQESNTCRHNSMPLLSFYTQRTTTIYYIHSPNEEARDITPIIYNHGNFTIPPAPAPATATVLTTSCQITAIVIILMSVRLNILQKDSCWRKHFITALRRCADN
ncbi:hypothetical protein GQX74_003958 [Glossina fuscipes]|nr:hypothetical protein GQX74_003958 [Glossina fuscipes]